MDGNQEGNRAGQRECDGGVRNNETVYDKTVTIISLQFISGLKRKDKRRVECIIPR